jgi:DNA-binding beta-propeller fold protein YncE
LEWKKVILINQSIEGIPFDIGSLRYIKYDNTHPGVQKLRHSLIETLKPFLNEKQIPFRVVKGIGNRGSGPSEFNELRGLAIGKEGRIYLSDKDNHRIQIFTSEFKFERSFGVKGSEPGQFDGPRGIAIDNDGNVFVVDTGNKRIQKFDYAGTFIDQFGSEDEQSLLIHPWGLSIDKIGNIYVSSARGHKLHKFDNKGRFIKYWGGFGRGDDQFYNPLGVAIDKFQNVYVADYGNNRIQKFDQEGNFLLKWGASRYEPGEITRPHALAIYDSIIYVTEAANFKIQLFDLNGNYLGTLQTMPEIVFYNISKGLAVDNEGNIYVAKTDQIIKLTRI